MPDIGAPWDVQDRPVGGELDLTRDSYERARDVLGLEELLYRNLLDGNPDSKPILFGGGNQPEQTLIGDQAKQFRAVAILNYSGAIVQVGFASGAGQGANPFLVPAGMGYVIPQTFRDLSVAVSNAASAGVLLNPVMVTRLFTSPPVPLIFPLALPCGVGDTIPVNGQVASPAAGGVVIATTGPLPAGVYKVTIAPGFSGGAPTAPADTLNFQILNGGVVVGRPNPVEIGGNQVPAPTILDRITVGAGNAISVQTVAAGTGGVDYTAGIQATRLI